ncbi:MAG: AAA family ATPase [Deltaproteobacteria bacterium]|nr:AAA family ATPase [Deltaproteobacteria bacterium]
MSDELALRVEAVFVRALLAVAERDKLVDAIEPLRARCEQIEARLVDVPHGAMHELATRFALTPSQVAFLWAAIAVAIEPRITVHAESLGGPPGRKGLSVALYQRMTGLDAGTGRELAMWLARDNALVGSGLLVRVGEAATPAARTYLAPARLCAYLSSDSTIEEGLVGVARVEQLLFDDAQTRVLEPLSRVLAGPAVALVVVEGASGTGRASAVAHAAGRSLAVLNVARLQGEDLADKLLALRRESELGDVLPVISDIERVGEGGAALLGAFFDQFPTTIVVITSQIGMQLGTSRAVVRVRWPVPDTPIRRALWDALGDHPDGDLDMLAQRYRVGPGSIARAIESARLLGAGKLSVEELTVGLRHNIAEELGGLAQRVEVTQSWDELVLADDTRGQVDALIARVRHAHQVLERWGYRGKMARGTGVAALFSGPPGTGKTMVAGLIARELELELYQVDLSQVVSKWIGETEKQLARVFEAAEQGHALLLFDEADALFGQRTADVKGATDRYANLEVNYLLQRVESFGGITILTTNLDTAIDRALKRRLAAHIVFDQPDEDDRTELWQRLATTRTAPIDDDVDYPAMSRLFPKMTGANIRNAALSAAFLAAADQAARIRQSHLLRAARAEYRSMGFVLSESVR